MQHARRQWSREKRAALLYRVVSDLESGTPRQLLFLELAKDADSEAMHWELEMKKAGLPAPAPYLPGPVVRLTVQLLSWFGTASLRWLLSAWGLRGLRVFGAAEQAARPLQGAQQTAPAAGRKHSRYQVEAVYGIHDAVLAQICLLLFMAGAGVGSAMMLFAGAVGLLAGALATAAALMLSGRAGPAVGEELLPDLRELAEVYVRRGMVPEVARLEARRVLIDLELLDPDQPLTVRRPGTPTACWQPALIAFFSFAAGAAVPVLPYLLEVQRHPLMMGCSLALVVLFISGWRLAGMAGRITLWGGLRAAALGCAGGGLSYLVGKLVAALI